MAVLQRIPCCHRTTGLFNGWCPLIVGVLCMNWAQPAWSVEPYFGYYDEVPPIDEAELNAARERLQEARARLPRAGPATEPDRFPQPAPLPPPIVDERDGAPPIDFQEVDELRKTFQSLQEQRLRDTAAAPTQPAPTPKESLSPELEQQVQKLNQRVGELERVLVGTEEHQGLAGMIGGYTRHNGFFLMSGDGDFFLRLPLLLQTDLRTFPGGQNGANPGVNPSTFIIERARTMVHFRLWRYFRGYMTPDFGNGFTNNPNVQGRVQVPDAFGEWDYFSLFRIRMGKFKSPIGLEMLQAPQNLSFMERSLTRNLLPNRDLGAMVWGVYERGLFEYQLGVFNGVPNANFYQESAATGSAKTLEARIFSRPFVASTTSIFRGLGYGVGMSVGSVKQGTSGQDPMQTETFSYTFFQYNSNVTGDGQRIRISPQVAWYVGRLGVLGQYVRSTQQLRLVTGGPSVRTTHESWSAQASWFLTDDTATFGHVQPRYPVEPSKGHWGAWEIAVRYAQLNIDPETFAYNLADPTINVLRAKSSTVGLNWYLNTNVRLAANFVHTDFTGATRAYRAASHEDGLMFRMQMTF